MKKVLFLHGFTSSGQCEIANTLREELAPKAEVISPDIPLHPTQALEMVTDILRSEDIDLLVGSSCGAYYALLLADKVDIPMVLINPQRTMVEFLKERIGTRKYKSPRLDGKEWFSIDRELIEEFSELGEPNVSEECQERIFILLGDQDPLQASRKEDFSHKAVFHGSHTMNAEQVKEYLSPKCREILMSQEDIVLDRKDGIIKRCNTNGGSMAYDSMAYDSMGNNSIILKSIPLKDYITQCRNAEYFIGFCKECRNYGKSWACPPLVDKEIEEHLLYKWATLVANHIVPEDPRAPLSEASNIMKPTRKITERILLQAEKVFPGRSFAFAGTCLYCPEGTCTRLENKPCRHPELVRPSLEAVGLDISKTSEILGIDLLWSKDEYVPEYLTLVSGFFHNGEPQEVEEFLGSQYLEKERKEIGGVRNEHPQ